MISAANRHLYEDVLEQHFRLRHEIFVEERKWEALRKPDGREIDAYDNDDSIYLLSLENRRVLGGYRLYPTTKPTMSWSYGDDANTFKNSSVTLVDAALKYDFGQAAKELKGLQFQVNAKNLFNLHYTTCQVGYCYRGAPLTVIATLGYRW